MKTFFAIMFITMLNVSSFGQDKQLGERNLHNNSNEARRLALVVGNLNYESGSYRNITNTVRDADSMKVALEYIGFEVTKLTDLPQKEFEKAVDNFVSKLRTDDVAFFYYSGHGASENRINYLIPTDYTSNCVGDLKYDCLSLEAIVGKINNRGVRNTIAVIDACRDLNLNYCGNETRGSRISLVKPENNPPGTLIAFATDYGNVSNDRSANNLNGLYTESLLKYLRKPYNLSTIFDSTTIVTLQTSQRLKLKNVQHPVFESRILGINSFYFIKEKDVEPFWIKQLREKDLELSETKKLLQSFKNAELPTIDDKNEDELLYSKAKDAFYKKDYVSALPLMLAVAQKNGQPFAQSCLGYMYYKGLGVNQDYQKAFSWYQKSADQEDADAQGNLGYMYANGLGVKQDYQKAVLWYQKSTDQGNATAQINLGYMYYEGLGVEQDYQKAILWYQKSADLGYAYAQFNLGVMYELGKGVPENISEALKWYRLSATRGNQDAKRRIDELTK